VGFSSLCWSRASRSTCSLLAIVPGRPVATTIIVVENVERHLHLGRSLPRPRSAARELVGPIIAMTITLVAVYAPIGIQGGSPSALPRVRVHARGAGIVSGVVALRCP
jgi:multidrug efflux pump